MRAFPPRHPCGCRLVAVGDKNKPSSGAGRAGRGLGRLLEKLLGRDSAGRLAASAEVLRREFEVGKREHEDEPPRPIPHRELPEDDPE